MQYQYRTQKQFAARNGNRAKVPTCWSSWTEADSGSPSATLAIIVMRTMVVLRSPGGSQQMHSRTGKKTGNKQLQSSYARNISRPLAGSDAPANEQMTCQHGCQALGGIKLLRHFSQHILRDLACGYFRTLTFFLWQNKTSVKSK